MVSKTLRPCGECRWIGGGACGDAGVEVRRWSGVGAARRGAGVELLRWKGRRRPGGSRLLATAGFGHDLDVFLGGAAGQSRHRPGPPPAGEMKSMTKVRWRTSNGD
jgi:hypothetical protein